MREIGNRHTYSGFNEYKLKDMDRVLVGENSTADYYGDRNNEISELERNHAIDNIHIYGMKWNMSSHVHSNKEAELLL